MSISQRWQRLEKREIGGFEGNTDLRTQNNGRWLLFEGGREGVWLQVTPNRALEEEEKLEKQNEKGIFWSNMGKDERVHDTLGKVFRFHSD